MEVDPRLKYTPDPLSTEIIQSLSPRHLPSSMEEYFALEEKMANMEDVECLHLTRVMAREDLYFLLRYVLTTRDWKDPENKERSFWDKEWLLARCREIQFSSVDTLNIWARYHAKSTICTFGNGIRLLLSNPNETIGIFSVTKGVADEFVAMIRHELESNEELKALYPDRLYNEPRKEAPRWTIEKGFTIRRTLNLAGASVRGFGLTDSNYTGHRFSKQIFDDAVNETGVTSPDMIEKTIRGWELALNTGFPGTERFYCGTFYMHGDAYHEMVKRGITLSLHPCYRIDYERSRFDDNGLPIDMVYDRDDPVLFSRDHLVREEKIMGRRTFGVQMLSWPQAGAINNFKYSWLNTYFTSAMKVRKKCNVVILVDPAASRKKDSSNTAMWVVGLGDDGNYYVLDFIIDKMNLHQRTNMLFDLVLKWDPLEVRYEKYSMQADIQHIQYVMEQRSFRFNIREVGGSTAKDDRIEKLVPLFANGEIYFPKSKPYTNFEGEYVDLVKWFVENEYLVFPNGTMKDGLDGLSRIAEKGMPLPWPRKRAYKKKGEWEKDWERNIEEERETTWMAS